MPASRESVTRVGTYWDSVICGNARGGIRTHDLRLRRPTLYPAELRAREYVKYRLATAFATAHGEALEEVDGAETGQSSRAHADDALGCAGEMGGGGEAED